MGGDLGSRCLRCREVFVGEQRDEEGFKTFLWLFTPSGQPFNPRKSQSNRGRGSGLSSPFESSRKCVPSTSKQENTKLNNSRLLVRFETAQEQRVSSSERAEAKEWSFDSEPLLHLAMTSHTSLQMPSLSPKAPVPQRPSANNVEAAIQHFNSLLELPSVTRATFLPSSATDEAKNSESDTLYALLYRSKLSPSHFGLNTRTLVGASSAKLTALHLSSSPPRRLAPLHFSSHQALCYPNPRTRRRRTGHFHVAHRFHFARG